MWLFKKKTPGKVCQNCKNGNNKKGKHIYHWYRKGSNIGVDENDNLIKVPYKGYWYIFCENIKKFFPWDKHKRCFQKKVIKYEKINTRNVV